jgi:hypothetical protein
MSGLEVVELTRPSVLAQVFTLYDVLWSLRGSAIDSLNKMPAPLTNYQSTLILISEHSLCPLFHVLSFLFLLVQYRLALCDTMSCQLFLHPEVLYTIYV